MAVLLAALVLVASAEPLLAEAHDGDAPRAVAAGQADGWTAGSAVPPVASVEMSIAATPASAHHAPGGRLPIHAVHVCHCAHVHGGLLVPEPFVLTTRVRPTVRRVDARSDRVPASSRLEPLLRPPLLPHGA